MIPATPAHGAVLAAIHAAAFPPGERWGADALSLQLQLPGAAGWLSGMDGFVMFRVTADEAEILTVAVLPARRGRGIGRALLKMAAQSAKAAGASALFLEVAEGNAPAEQLYRSFGFAEVGRRPRYYPGGGAARVLRRDLGAFMPGAAQAG